jgi:hypothetical protein
MCCYQCDQKGPAVSSGKGKALGMIQGWRREKEDMGGNGGGGAVMCPTGEIPHHPSQTTT